MEFIDSLLGEAKAQNWLVSGPPTPSFCVVLSQAIYASLPDRILYIFGNLHDAYLAARTYTKMYAGQIAKIEPRFERWKSIRRTHFVKLFCLRRVLCILKRRQKCNPQFSAYARTVIDAKLRKTSRHYSGLSTF